MITVHRVTEQSLLMAPARTAQSRLFPLVTYSPLKPHNPIPALIGPALTHPRPDWSALAAVTGGVTYI